MQKLHVCYNLAFAPPHQPNIPTVLIPKQFQRIKYIHPFHIIGML